MLHFLFTLASNRTVDLVAYYQEKSYPPLQHSKANKRIKRREKVVQWSSDIQITVTVHFYTGYRNKHLMVTVPPSYTAIATLETQIKANHHVQYLIFNWSLKLFSWVQGCNLVADRHAVSIEPRLVILSNHVCNLWPFYVSLAASRSYVPTAKCSPRKQWIDWRIAIEFHQ